MKVVRVIFRELCYRNSFGNSCFIKPQTTSWPAAGNVVADILERFLPLVHQPSNCLLKGSAAATTRGHHQSHCQSHWDHLGQNKSFFSQRLSVASSTCVTEKTWWRLNCTEVSYRAPRPMEKLPQCKVEVLGVRVYRDWVEDSVGSSLWGRGRT